MKTFVLTITVMLTGILGMQAQDISKHALGLRLGDNDGFGAEISYQLALKENNRLEFDLGWRNSNNFNAIKVVGLYHWVFNIDKGFNWYVGPGGGLGFWSYDNGFLQSNGDDSGSFFFIAGDIGIEYSFDFPLQLSLDFRPEIGFGDFNDDLDFDIGLGVRYQF